jgi:hypothetical protein
MKVATCLVVFLGFCASAVWCAEQEAPSGGPYDADPGHPWNRLHDVLFMRTAPTGERYGAFELDPLFWENTRYLLTSPSREKALQVLDGFLRTHAERLIHDPLKRALMQRDLWALFDWSADPRNRSDAEARGALQRRLAKLIRRLALSSEEIEQLPGNLSADPALASAGLRGLSQSDGDWVLVGRPGDFAAPEHRAAFGGRSVFLVFVQFPGGREPALQYLKDLSEFTPALVYPHDIPPALAALGYPRRLVTNDQTVQFPAGTQWALVRRMCLIDKLGNIRMSPVVESIQVRRYVTIPSPEEKFDALRDSQVAAEYQMDRVSPPQLRAILPGEVDFQFVHFRSMGWDPLENSTLDVWQQNFRRYRSETLRTCKQCHTARGILSVNSYAQFGTEANVLEPSTLDREMRATIEWKYRQFDWGRLGGAW